MLALGTLRDSPSAFCTLLAPQDLAFSLAAAIRASQGGRGRPRAHRMLTETTPVQGKLTEIFNLARYAPRR